MSLFPEAPKVVPEGWPLADVPRTIAILGWARLSEQGDQGSGYNLSASELASGLAAMGHRVVGLSSGMRFSLRPGIRFIKDERWRGIDQYALVNSPCVAPAALNFGNLEPETSAPHLDSALLSMLDRLGVEILHIHSLEGWTLSLIEAVRATGRPVVVTLHNYWFVCPQVDLLREERRVCLDYEQGRACESCVNTGAAPKKRRRRAVSQAMFSVIGKRATDLIRDTIDDAAARARGKKPQLPRFTPLSRSGLPLDAAQGLNAPSSLLRPSLPPDDATIDAAPPYDTPPTDANQRMLAEPDRHRQGDTPFARRRSRGIAALNAASVVTAPSRYLLEVHAAMGAETSRLRHVPLGQPHFDEIHRVTRASPYYTKRPWDPATAARPLRFAFHGTLRPNKGLEVLARAIPLLPPDVLEQAQFNIRAIGHDTPLRRRLAPYPQVTFEGQYDIPKLVRATATYDVGILSHIWLENAPLVMWEHLHAGKFVLSPRLGGPAEVIKEGANGSFFDPGNPASLATRIATIVRGDPPLPPPADIHAATDLRSYPEHVQAMASLYDELASDAP